MAFAIRAENVRDPSNSEVIMLRVEDAPGCDGIERNTAVAGEDGTPMSYIPHDRHIVVSGHNPSASSRYFAITPVA
jgi:hypothetical protein